MRLTKQFTITVDTEEEWDWSQGYSTGQPRVSNIQALPDFQQACDKFDARVTYFVDYAVLADATSADIISRLSEHPNVEIGFHIHPWNTPPLANTDTVRVRNSFLHNLPEETGRAKLASVFEIFEKHGIRPTSFRGGRYSTCDWIQDCLRSNGIIADASIMPFTTWPDEGAPDFRDRDLNPKRVSPTAARAADQSFMWEIPLTIAFTRKPWSVWNRIYQAGRVWPLKHLKLIPILERTIVNQVWLNLEHPLGESIPLLLPRLRTSELPCINFTMHSSSLVPGLNPYVRTESQLSRLYERLEAALDLLCQWNEFESATVSEVALRLEEDHHESLGHKSTR